MKTYLRSSRIYIREHFCFIKAIFKPSAPHAVRIVCLPDYSCLDLSLQLFTTYFCSETNELFENVVIKTTTTCHSYYWS